MTQTVDNIKYGAKLTASAAFSFIKIYILGSISTILVVGISVITMTRQIFETGSGPGPVHSNGLGFILVLFNGRPIAFVLTICIFFVSFFILISLGNKYVLMKTANRIIIDKGESIIHPLIEKIINRVKERQPELFKKGADTAKLKLKFLQEIKDSEDNKWTKRITTFGLNKVELNDVDFGNENLSFSEIIKIKIFKTIQNIGKPSKRFFWITIIIQWLILILIIFKIV